MRWLLALVGGLVLGWAQAQDCPELVHPRGRVQMVAPDVVANGLPVKVLRFDGEQAVEAVLAHYQRLWAGEGAQAPMMYDMGQWRVVAAMRDGCFYTVQVQAAGLGTTALISVSDVRRSTPPVVAMWQLPMPASSELLSELMHRDSGRPAQTWVLRNGFSPRANADFFQRRLSAEGWRLMRDDAVNIEREPNVLMHLRRDGALLDLVISPEGVGATVVANWQGRP